MEFIKFKSIIFMLVLGLAVLFSGCIDEADADIPTELNLPTTAAANESIQVSKLENKIDSMQQQIDNLQNRIDRVDLLKPSDKQLIPRVPFRMEIYFAEWDTPMTYTFKENAQLEIKGSYGSTTSGQYILYRENNTIKLSSRKDKFYGLVIYDDYVTAIFENGWIGWVHKYKTFPPKYNSIRQMYELN